MDKYPFPAGKGLSLSSTGDVYSYTNISTRLTGATGIHDVYLVFTGDLRIASFSLK
jgi:beta-glucosidase